MNSFIESNPAVMMGKLVIRGSRITVEHVLEKLAAGETIDEILQAHPRLTRDGILAALEFAQALAHEMESRPTRIRGVSPTLVRHARSLVKGVQIDLYAPAPEDE